jgi:hypothetical protein
MFAVRGVVKCDAKNCNQTGEAEFNSKTLAAFLEGCMQHIWYQPELPDGWSLVTTRYSKKHYCPEHSKTT